MISVTLKTGKEFFLAGTSTALASLAGQSASEVSAFIDIKVFLDPDYLDETLGDKIAEAAAKRAPFDIDEKDYPIADMVLNSNDISYYQIYQNIARTEIVSA